VNAEPRTSTAALSTTCEPPFLASSADYRSDICRNALPLRFRADWHHALVYRAYPPLHAAHALAGGRRAAVPGSSGSRRTEATRTPSDGLGRAAAQLFHHPHEHVRLDFEPL